MLAFPVKCTYMYLNIIFTSLIKYIKTCSHCIFSGLASILFAISIDNSELNTIKPATGLDLLLTSTPPQNYPQNFASRMDEEPRPVIAGDVSPIGKFYRMCNLIISAK